MKVSMKSVLPTIITALLIMPSAASLAGQKASSALKSSALSAAKLHLKTSVAEVNGVREIELGQFEKGIRKSKASLAKASVAALKKPLLDNLCVAHIAINELEEAQRYCDDAVNTGRPSAISYNNRAVMHYVAGNVAASLEDLDSAAALRNFASLVQGNLMLVNKRNILSKN